MNFLNHRFHTIGKYVQNYRYRLSTNMANINLIPIISQSLVQLPLLFILMSGSRKSDYQKNFQELLDILPTPISLRKVTIDF